MKWLLGLWCGLLAVGGRCHASNTTTSDPGTFDTLAKIDR
jgi:hypothetical protein